MLRRELAQHARNECQNLFSTDLKIKNNSTICNTKHSLIVLTVLFQPPTICGMLFNPLSLNALFPPLFFHDSVSSLVLRWCLKYSYLLQAVRFSSKTV